MADNMAELNRAGRETFGKLVAGGEERLDRIFKAVPALGELAVGTVYGHLHGRRALDPRTREAAALAAIIASGCTETPLLVHVRTGLAAGLTPAEISEIVVETAAFAGFPRAVTAATKLADLFTEAGSPVPPDPAPREVLLGLLDSLDSAELPTAQVAALRSLVDSGHQPQVLTTGPGAALALFHSEDGTLLAAVQARVSGGKVTELPAFCTHTPKP